ncbi:MAG: hypothetical protein IK045_07260 [Bacteroidales bacterium]|nr:hypothetical protein [Bacteroidales bacterium]
MKKIWIVIAALAVLTGIIVVGCHRSDGGSKESQTFEEFGATILDYDYWKNIHSPGIMGPGDEATLVVGKIGDQAGEAFSGQISWSLSRTGVVAFVDVTKSTVSEDGTTATGNIVGIKAIGEGDVTVFAEDGHGTSIEHGFHVELGQHYTPEGELVESSSYYEEEESSSSEDEEESSSSAEPDDLW